jgi:hypothetical protein
MFIILVPYVSILGKGFDNNKQLIDSNKNATRIQSNIGNITAANASMLVLVSSLDNTGKELSSLVSNISLFQLSGKISVFNNTVNNITKSNDKTKIQEAYPIVCPLAQRIATTINPISKANIDKLCMSPVQGSSSNVQNLTNLVRQLNAQVATLINVPSKNNTLLSTYPSCNNSTQLASDAWANCILKSNVEGHIKKYSDIFYNHILRSLNNLDDESKKLMPIEAFKRNFTAATDRFLQRSAIFFGENNATTPFQMSSEFRMEITNPLQNGINMLKDSQQKKLISIDDIIQKDKDEIISVERQKDNIAARLNSTQFVFGTLPLTLTQTVAGFPIALAVGFLICVTLLKSTIDIFWELKTVHTYIAFIAPLWIYPTGSRLNIIARFLVFSTPFVLFITAWCLIGYSFTLCPHNKDLLNIFGVPSECVKSYMDSFRIADFHIWIYTILYAVSFVAFIIGFVSIIWKFLNPSYKQQNQKKLTH